MIDNIEVKPTENMGYGVFALKPFSPGNEIIDIAYGRVLTLEQCEDVPFEISHQMDRKDEDHYYFMTYPEYFINHGCDPNVYQKDGMVYAMKPINKNEQLFFEYAMNGTETWEMNCFCELPKCRNKVSGNFFDLPLGLQKSYQPYLQDWFISKFKGKLEILS